MLRSQPSFITVYARLIANYLWGWLANHTSRVLWQVWVTIIQVTILAIAFALYREPGPRRGKPPKLERMAMTAWRIVTTNATHLLNLLERTLTRTDARQRRMVRAANLHRTRSRRTAMAMSVLAMATQDARPTERRVYFDTDSEWVGVDNRCSGCISHVRTDFIGELQESNRIIKGFGGTKTANVKVGTLRWAWDDTQGKRHSFDIPHSYYVPTGKTRLLSPQHWAQSQSKNRKQRRECGERTDGNECVLYWGDGKYNLHMDLDPRNNVASFPLSPGYTQFKAFCTEADLDDPFHEPVAMPASMISDDEHEDETDVDEVAPQRRSDAWQPTTTPDYTPDTAITVEFDLNGPPSTASEGEKHLKSQDNNLNVIIDEEDRQPLSDMAQLLLEHHKYGHISMRKLQEMAKQGILPRRLAKCRVPTCSACLYAKATKKPWRGKPSIQQQDSNQATKPGHVVSVDQMVSPTPGLIAQMTGFLTTKRYKYATVFVDQFTRLGFVYLQKSASAEETVEAKKAFEAYSRRQGIHVENYLADNGIFKAHGWVAECKQARQGLTFAGVNAHHQNGVAERRIRELQELARASLIHASHRWPDAVTANLWPYAIRMANDAINHTPSFQHKERRSPMELFAKTQVVSNPKHWKPFGCPVYVLENELQSGGPFHKWRHRSKMGVYVGRSPQHDRNVALVLSLETGLVSPQFHVTFDPSFQTVKDFKGKSKWQNKAGFVGQREPLRPTGNNVGAKVGAPKGGTAASTPTTARKRKRRELTSKSGAGTPESREREPAAETIGGDGSPIPQDDDDDVTVKDKDYRVQVTRSGRKTKPPLKLLDAMVAEVEHLTSGDVKGEIFCLQSMFPDDQYAHDDPLLAYKAVSDPDTLYYHQAMREPDKNEFLEGMKKEIDDQFANGNFTVVHKSKVPKGQIVLPAVWQMRRKRDVRTGKIKKYKARLNIDGSRMRQGEHYDQTYSPVASWNSVRMLLTMTAVHGWHTKQIDFVQAFAQAPVERTLYMKVPAGITLEDGADQKDYVLMIHRNIYGQKQAGRVWNKFLVSKLVGELGFKQSKVDECVFYRGKTLYVLYTDDSLLAGPDPKEIEKVIDELQSKAKLSITVEGDLADFLGVNIDRRKDGTIHMSQPHLIDQILDDLRLSDSSAKARSTPAASSKLLTRHTASQSFDGSFNYRSVIGKLNYLEKATRSDISFAVHQCARFVSDPKKEHGDAVRWLGRYLKGTRDKGTIIRPVSDKDLEVYVDASFCGDWDPTEAAQDRDTARSRHGYIINYAGCPLLWKSQLQTEIAMSSTESEYTGLSYALRDAIPIMELLKEMKKRGHPIRTAEARVHCRVFEDNSGALEMAKIHKYRPRTKHLNVRLHHFRDYVERGEISIHDINTNDQPADFLTKALNEDTLVKHRMTVLGW